jgi:hypothetical protein
MLTSAIEPGQLRVEPVHAARREFLFLAHLPRRHSVRQRFRAMKTLVLIVSVVSLAPAADAPGPTAEQIVKTYAKTLTRMTKHLQPIGLEFALAGCRTVAPNEPKQKYGPHLKYFVNYFRNDLAREQGEKFPEGAVIVKEKLTTWDSKEQQQPLVEAVAGMIKRPAGSLPKTGDWEFFWFADGKVSTQDAQSCAGCHSGAKRDSVFSDPPAR